MCEEQVMGEVRFSRHMFLDTQVFVGPVPTWYTNVFHVTIRLVVKPLEGLNRKRWWFSVVPRP